MHTGETPAAPEKPLNNNSYVSIGLVIILLGAAATAGSAHWRLQSVEKAQADHEVESRADARAQTAKDAAQDLAITSQAERQATQGRDIDAILKKVDRIDQRMERWEERGFRPARGGQ